MHKILFLEPPKIIKESQNGYEENKYAKVGDQTLMVCISKGYPTPKITWTAPNNSRYFNFKHSKLYFAYSSSKAKVFFSE